MDTENNMTLLSISVGYNKLTREVTPEESDRLFTILCNALNNELCKDTTISQSRVYPSFRQEGCNTGFKFIPEEKENCTKQDVDDTQNESIQSNNGVRLCFVKCPICGRMHVGVLDSDDAFLRSCDCGEEIRFHKNELKRGMYECECGRVCNFYMTDSISYLKCKDCGRGYYMIYDEEKDLYIGESADIAIQGGKEVED